TPSSSPAQDNALSRHERGFESRWGRSQLFVFASVFGQRSGLCHLFATEASGFREVKSLGGKTARWGRRVKAPSLKIATYVATFVDTWSARFSHSLCGGGPSCNCSDDRP